MFNAIFSTDNQADVEYLDFRKAFDSVPHNELVLKLHTIGISGRLWLSYLLNQHQCVKVNNCLSQLLLVLSRIQQGSILGLSYFLSM